MLCRINLFTMYLILFIFKVTASEKIESINDELKINQIKLPISKVLIVGGGLGGLAVAKSLQNVGCTQIDLIEKKSTFCDEGAGIALPANASWALEKLGINFEDYAYLINEMVFTDDKAKILCHEDLKHIHGAGSQFYSIDRSSLHKILLNSLSTVNMRMNTTIDTFKENSENITVTFSDKTNSCYDLVIAADGIHSTMRKLCNIDDTLEPLGVHTWRTIIKTPKNLLSPTYMLGENSIFLLYPLANHQTYIYAHRAQEKLRSDHQETTIKDISETFKNFCGDVPYALEQIGQTENILSHFMYTSSIKWRHGKRILFIGDAAHAFSPTLQNGAAQAFEDAYVLGDLMKNNDGLEKCLTSFVTRRNPRVGWITAMSNQKMIAINQEQVIIRNKNIQEKGAPNVRAFIKFMKTNP